jgi:hypothetical protein
MCRAAGCTPCEPYQTAWVEGRLASLCTPHLPFYTGDTDASDEKSSYLPHPPTCTSSNQIKLKRRLGRDASPTPATTEPTATPQPAAVFHIVFEVLAP